MTSEININSSILTWARETAGLELAEAAERLGFSSSDRMSAEEKLTLIERGVRQPTRKQLADFASLYRRPLITFYMSQPPVRADRGEDFRRTAASVSRRDNALLDALLRDVRARQEMIRDLLEDDEDHGELNFVGSASPDLGPTAVARSIARKLNFDYTSLSSRKGNTDDLFKSLRGKSENIGVFVLLIGDVGSYHSALSAEVFRGFAIADRIAPFIVINDQDAKSARSFTLVHELAHLWLGQTGVSGTPDTTPPRTAQERLERFCNDVAGEFLLPSTSLGQRPGVLEGGDVRITIDVVNGIAEQWSVSEPMVAYRLKRLGWISEVVYDQLVATFIARWGSAKLRAKDNRKPDDSGPSYYVVKQSKLGGALLDVVSRTLRGNLLTYTKAAKVLGVKQSSVEPLLRGYEQSRGAFIHNARG